MYKNSKTPTGCNPNYEQIYTLIARQIIEKLKVNAGTAIEVGSGSGSLSLAMTRITSFKIYSMDISPEMCQIASKSIEREGLMDRITPKLGDVHQMPFPDEFADVIFSIGSIIFWNDLTVAFKEIYRVLKPGGVGYVGRGFGSPAAKQQFTHHEQVNHQELKHHQQKNQEVNHHYKIHDNPKIHADTLEKAVINAGIRNYLLINDESGLWVLFKKLNKCIS
ncbi:class I SAM-dependent methyltransferase [uncultured Methanobacterium sp.]|uniref:class I SAM-dependent methyltransferase n=1 Tax=uncultured Methanobacterium sp. TaxID=176306 RepID=UPI002AA792B5|nr:class I SAM-dependent methyltransferase [uncultured Methanobacterium sp.]